MSYDVYNLAFLAKNLKGEIRSLVKDIYSGERCSQFPVSQDGLIKNIKSTSRELQIILALTEIKAQLERWLPFNEDRSGDSIGLFRKADERLGKLESYVLDFVDLRQLDDQISERYRKYAQNLGSYREAIELYLGERN